MSELSPSGRSPHFHPHQLSVCGYSGAGKTTLLVRLIQGLSTEYRVGYVKHDAHGFQMDRPGKDTHRATEAGAAEVLINDAGRSARLAHRPLGRTEAAYLMLDCDWVFIEGYKTSDVPKILVLDQEGRASREWREGGFQNVVAVVGTIRPTQENGAPWFHRDDVDGLLRFVREFWRREARRTPLYGLVLAGGEGEPRALYLHRLLSEHCDRTFLSLGTKQSASPAEIEASTIADRFLGMGPAGSILSAMHTYPDAAWLVVGTSVPYVNEEVVRRLVTARAPFKIASSHPGTGEHLPEPLCTIYEPKARLRLLQSLGLGEVSLREVLIEAGTALIGHDAGG